MVLRLTTGAEAVEAAIKDVGRWGYAVQGVPRDEAVSIAVEGRFYV